MSWTTYHGDGSLLCSGPGGKPVPTIRLENYRDGLTPSPCVLCNSLMKFRHLLRLAEEVKADRIATGHYARVEEIDGQAALLKGVDPTKDQSYFLHRLTQQQLSRILFPLGEQTKENVYKMAAEFGISGIHGSESQDVCFIRGQSYGAFLAETLGLKPSPGDIEDVRGNRIGRHQGQPQEHDRQQGDDGQRYDWNAFSLHDTPLP